MHQRYQNGCLIRCQSVISFANPQVITSQPIVPNTLSLNISFANSTNATLVEEPITEEQGNLIISAINAILLSDDNSEALAEDLEELEPVEEPEIEEEEESDGDNGDGDGNDNGDGNGDD